MVNLEGGRKKVVFKNMDKNISGCRHNPIEHANKFTLLLKYIFTVDPFAYLKTGIMKCAYCGAPLLPPKECFQLPINIIYFVYSAALTILSLKIVLFLDFPPMILTILGLTCYYSALFILIRLSLAHIFTFCKWRVIDIEPCDANLHSHRIKEDHKNKFIHQNNIMSMAMFLALLYYIEFQIVYFIPVEAIIVGIKSIKRRRNKIVWLCVISVLFTMSYLVMKQFFSDCIFETLVDFISAVTMISLAFVEDSNR